MKVFVIFFTNYLNGTKIESFYNHEQKNEIFFFSNKILNFNVEPRT